MISYHFISTLIQNLQFYNFVTFETLTLKLHIRFSFSILIILQPLLQSIITLLNKDIILILTICFPIIEF
jgi:hypothetical protein